MYHLTIRQAVACILLIFLTGCTIAATPSPLPSPAGVPQSDEIATLVLWHGWSIADRQVLNRLVARFNQQQGDTRVILQAMPLATFEGNLRGKLAAGSGPDMILIPNAWIGSLAEANALLPLDDWISTTERQQLLPMTLAGAQRRSTDGAEQLYGLPISFDTLALYYNKANVLTLPAGTAELLSMAHGLSDPRATPARWGLTFNLSLDMTIGYLSAAGGRFFDEQGKLVLGTTGRAGTERWLRWLLQLSSDEHVFARADSSVQFDRQLTNSSTLMTVDWAHQFTLYRSLWGTNLGIAPLPRFSETAELPRPYVRSDVLAINRRIGPNERQPAIDFLRFMISEAAQRELLRSDIQSVRQDLKLGEADLDQLQARAARAFRQQAEQGIAMPNGPTQQRTFVRRVLEQMLQQVLLHAVSPAEAVTEADQRLREAIGPAGQPGISRIVH